MITIVTAISDNKDDLREDFNFEGANFIAYTNDTPYSPNWEIREPYNRFIDPVRNAKIHKVLIHQFIPSESDYSIWIDGNISFNVPAQTLVDELLGDGDIWAMTHFYTKDVYEEALNCHSLDQDPNSVFTQVARYRQQGFPEQSGMYECNVLIRRNNEKTKLMNRIWWDEICTQSRRDQVSFPYAVHKSGVDLRTTKGNVRQHPYFSYILHNHSKWMAA